MKKVSVLYSANIEKTFEISDELYSEISNDEFDWRAFDSMFELSPNPYIYLRNVSMNIDINKRALKDVMDAVLEDDDTPWGGVSYKGETVRDFLSAVDIYEEIKTVSDLNDALRRCGIKPV